jgi:hypothetical protein
MKTAKIAAIVVICFFGWLWSASGFMAVREVLAWAFGVAGVISLIALLVVMESKLPSV